MEPYEKVVLYIEPELLRILDNRRILEGDLRRVVLHAEETGRRLRHNQKWTVSCQFQTGQYHLLG